MAAWARVNVLPVPYGPTMRMGGMLTGDAAVMATTASFCFVFSRPSRWSGIVLQVNSCKWVLIRVNDNICSKCDLVYRPLTKHKHWPSGLDKYISCDAVPTHNARVVLRLWFPWQIVHPQTWGRHLNDLITLKPPCRPLTTQWRGTVDATFVQSFSESPTKAWPQAKERLWKVTDNLYI